MRSSVGSNEPELYRVGLASAMSATTHSGPTTRKGMREMRSDLKMFDMRSDADEYKRLSHKIAIPMASPRRRIGMARVLERKASERVDVGLLARRLNKGDGSSIGYTLTLRTVPLRINHIPNRRCKCEESARLPIARTTRTTPAVIADVDVNT